MNWDDFKVIEKNELKLIFPRRSKFKWQEDERKFRSVILKDDKVISSGWPKFGNYGEFKEDTDIINKNINNVIFTNKEDGTLCIRYVYNNKVFFRTRATFDGGKYSEDFFNVAKRYPILLNHTKYSHLSLLFEYVSPRNRVVVPYPNDDLIFIGFMNGLKCGSWKDTKEIAEKEGLNLVKTHSIPPTKLREEVRGWKTEGIVARYNKTMVKVKSAHYLQQHRIRFSLNYKFLLDFLENNNIKNQEKLEQEFKGDWELLQDILKYYREYEKANKQVDKYIERARDVLKDFNGTRKELALKVKDSVVKHYVFACYDNDDGKLKVLRNKFVKNWEVKE